MSFVFATKFEPIVKVEENICLLPKRAEIDDTYFRILFIEQLHPIDHDFGSLAAGASSGDVEIENLYLDKNTLGQYRAIPLDDIKILVKQPKARTRHATQKALTYISPFSHQMFATLHPNEFFIIEDDKIYFNTTNPGKYTEGKNRVRFIGYKFNLEPLTTVPKPVTYVPIEGWQASK